MELLKFSRHLILCSVTLALSLVGPLALAAEEQAPAVAFDPNNPRFKPERMWLPSSAQHLRPYLQLAVERALQDDTCIEILYARLNEYRTVYEEPTFSILCKKDHRSTFNRVYQVSELDEYYDTKVANSQAVAESTTELSGDIESLRQSLLVPSDAIVSNALPAAVAESLPSPEVVEQRMRREEDADDLSLDLDLDF